MFETLSKQPAGGVAGGANGANVRVSVQPQGSVQLDISWGNATGAASSVPVSTAQAKPAQAAAPKAAAAPKQLREIAMDEVC